MLLPDAFYDQVNVLSEKRPQPESDAPNGRDTILQGYLGMTPPIGQLPPRGERHWVDHPAQLLTAISMLKQSWLVAIDAEFTQVRTRTSNDVLTSVPRLALLQLAIDKHCFVIDALRLHDLSSLNAIFSDPEFVMLLHGAGADMRVMGERGLTVAHYYDLEATSRSIFGQHESSLAGMLQRAFNVRLDKSLQRTDWTRRPLPPAMIAYAARDAEVTLALYHWLDQHYHAILQLHENPGQSELAAAWIEPFLYATSTVAPEVAVAEAKSKGIIQNKAQLYADCRAALTNVKHPLRRARLLRLIADLSLTQLAPDIEKVLTAPTSDERAASARALGRLGVKSAKDAIQPLLQDPVQDVRKTAQLALDNLGTKEQRKQRTLPKKSVDGSRTWVVETKNTTSQANDGDDDWKTRLRSIL